MRGSTPWTVSPGHHGCMIAAAFPYILMAGYTVISLFALASGEAYLVARRPRVAAIWRATETMWFLIIAFSAASHGLGIRAIMVWAGCLVLLRPLVSLAVTSWMVKRGDDE